MPAKNNLNPSKRRNFGKVFLLGKPLRWIGAIILPTSVQGVKPAYWRVRKVVLK